MDNRPVDNRRGKKAIDVGFRVAGTMAPIAGNVVKGGFNAARMGANIALNAQAPGAGLGADVAFGLVGTVCEVCGTIIQMAKDTKANKAQSRRLGERIQRIAEAVRGLDMSQNPERYIQSLRKLEQTLGDAEKLVSKFQGRRWFKRVFVVGSDKESFAEIYRLLGEHIQDLHLGINVQQLMNEEESRRDAELDRDELKRNQAEILRLNQELKDAVSQQGIDAKEHHELLMKQMESMRTHFTDMLDQALKQGSYQSLRMDKEEGLDKRLIVPFHELDIEEKVAQGSFGTVYRGRWHEQVVALKLLEGQLSEEDKQEFIREVQITSQLKSPHVVQLYGASTEADRKCIILEYMSGGSLLRYLKGRSLTLLQKHQLALDVAQGLHYLHKQGVLHRDLKSANVLIDARGRGKLADFGLAKTKAASIASFGCFKQSQAIEWLSPEVLNRWGSYTEASDIYSLGVLLWEIFTGKEPLSGIGDNAVLNEIKKGPEREVIPETIPEGYRAIIRQCWSLVSAKRPSARQVILLLEKERAEYKNHREEHQSCGLDGETLYQRGIKLCQERQWEVASFYLSESAKLGYVRAQTDLGMLYLEGKLTAPSGKTGKLHGHYLLLSSAEQRHLRAITGVAYQFEKGDGIPQNTSKALFWYSKGAEQGDERSKSKVALLSTQSGSGYLRNMYGNGS